MSPPRWRDPRRRRGGGSASGSFRALTALRMLLDRDGNLGGPAHDEFPSTRVRDERRSRRDPRTLVERAEPTGSKAGERSTWSRASTATPSTRAIRSGRCSGPGDDWPPGTLGRGGATPTLPGAIPGCDSASWATTGCPGGRPGGWGRLRPSRSRSARSPSKILPARPPRSTPDTLPAVQLEAQAAAHLHHRTSCDLRVGCDPRGPTITPCKFIEGRSPLAPPPKTFGFFFFFPGPKTPSARPAVARFRAGRPAPPAGTAATPTRRPTRSTPRRAVGPGGRGGVGLPRDRGRQDRGRLGVQAADGAGARHVLGVLQRDIQARQPPEPGRRPPPPPPPPPSPPPLFSGSADFRAWPASAPSPT